MLSEVLTLSTSITIACIIAACLSLLASYRLMKPLPAKVSVRSTARPLSGILLLTSAAAWTALGISADDSLENSPNTSSDKTENQIVSFEEIAYLPATAAGIPPSFDQIIPPESSLPEAKVITEAEEIAEQPQSPEFQKLRNHVSQMLFSANNFDTSDNAILIDLSQDSHKDMIKYLADERPGLLTIIYHKQFDSGSRMVVYFPEIAGNQLIYTPLTGPASNGLSKVVKQSRLN